MLSAPAAPVSAPARRPRHGLLLAAGFAAQVVLRLWLFRYHIRPVANPDETGYLVAARWLTGGAGADFSGSTFYQGGYALLLAPAHLVTDDPVTVYRLVVVVGVAGRRGGVPLAYLMLRRLAVGARAAFAAGPRRRCCCSRGWPWPTRCCPPCCSAGCWRCTSWRGAALRARAWPRGRSPGTRSPRTCAAPWSWP